MWEDGKAYAGKTPFHSMAVCSLRPAASAPEAGNPMAGPENCITDKLPFQITIAKPKTRRGQVALLGCA